MSGMKTLLHGFALSLGLLATPSVALESDNHLQTFATCAGRLSAVMEYQWMFDGAASEQTKAQRAAVLDLIGAIMPSDRGRDVLQWRISAKLAQSALLTRATFNDDPVDAAWAQRTAARLTQECTGMLLS